MGLPCGDETAFNGPAVWHVFHTTGPLSTSTRLLAMTFNASGGALGYSEPTLDADENSTNSSTHVLAELAVVVPGTL